MSSGENNEDFFNNLQDFNVHFNEALSSDSVPELPLYNEVLENNRRYGDESFLDSGGMKSIYSCDDYKTARKVAIAKLKASSNHKNFEKFIKEARITAALEHPNIMPVYDLDVDERGEPFFAMKYIKGFNLEDYCTKEKPSLVTLMQIFLKICDAINYAHSKKIVHLDLKPANIQMGEFGEVLVCDWGIAKILGTKDETLENLDPDIYNDGTMDGMVKGSVGYLAPEQVNQELGDKDEKTDIYSLGGILYFMLSGQPPVSAPSTSESLKKTVSGNIESPARKCQVPEGLAAVCLKALELKKENRYKNVQELKVEIEKWLQGFATQAENAGFSRAFLLLIKRHKTVCSLIFLIIIVSSSLLLKAYFAEKKTLATLKLYFDEKKNSELMAKEEAPRLIGLGELAIKNYSFDEALNYSNLAVQRDPENIECWKLKGRVHFFRQEFNECLNALKSTSERTYRKIKSISQIYSTKKADSELLGVEEFKELHREFKHVQYAYLMCGYAEQNAPSLEFQIGIALFFLQEVTNPFVDQWNINYKKVGDQIDLDLSGNSKLTSLAGIRNLPILRLNISDTSVTEIHDILRMPLKKLEIKNCKILDPRPLLKISTLNVLVISKDQYKDVVFTVPSGVKILRE